MSGQVVNIYDARAAREARDDAVATVDAHAEAQWKIAALWAVQYVADLRDEFTTDAVWWLLEQAEVPPPHEERSMGAVMQSAARQGWIEPTDRTSKSVRPRCHARDLRVWKSLRP